jgi:hypothetical protein
MGTHFGLNEVSSYQRIGGRKQFSHGYETVCALEYSLACEAITIRRFSDKSALACAISTSYPSIVALLASGVVQVILTYSFSMLVTGALAGADGAVAAYTAA